MDLKRTRIAHRSLKSSIAAVSLSVALGACPALASADTAAEKQAEAEAAYESLCAMQQQLDEASNSYTEALFELEAAQERMDECQEQIDEKTGEIEEYQDKLAVRARSMYRTGGNTFIEVLVDSTTFEEFAGNFDMLMEMNEQDARLVERSKSARETLEEAQVEYVAQEQLAEEKTEEAAAIKEEAEGTVAEMQQVYDGLSAEAAELLEEERKAAEEEAARQAAAVVEASAAAGGEYEESEESRAFAEAQEEEEAEEGEESSDDEAADEQTAEGEEGDDSAEATIEEESPEPEPAPEEPEATYGGGGDTVSRAYACLGAPYSWGACGPGSFDCSGLVSYCLTGSYSRLGTTGTFMGWSQVSDPQPGDVCTSSYHCGIYIGDGQMIHAADYGIGVIVGPVQSDMIIVRW